MPLKRRTQIEDFEKLLETYPEFEPYIEVYRDYIEKLEALIQLEAAKERLLSSPKDSI